MLARRQFETVPFSPGRWTELIIRSMMLSDERSPPRLPPISDLDLEESKWRSAWPGPVPRGVGVSWPW